MTTKEAFEAIKKGETVEAVSIGVKYTLVTDEEDIEYIGENMIYMFRKSSGDFIGFDEFLKIIDKFKVVK